MISFLSSYGWILGIGWLSYLALGWPLPRVRTHRRAEKTPTRAIFHGQSVRATIAEVRLSGLGTEASADEALELVLNVDNYSGFPVRVESLSGFIIIFGDRKRPDPSANLDTIDELRAALTRIRDETADHDSDSYDVASAALASKAKGDADGD